jgi:hypothetical protein
MSSCSSFKFLALYVYARANPEFSYREKTQVIQLMQKYIEKKQDKKQW